MINFMGPEFLLWYMMFMVLSVVAGFAARSICLSVSSGEAIERSTLDSYDIAYLAEGPKRAFLAAVATLSHKNILEVGTVTRTLDCKATGISSLNLTELERLIVSRVQRKAETADKVYKAVESHFRMVEAKLIKHDLLASESRFMLSRMIPAGIVALLPVVIGIPKYAHGVAIHKPVTFLVLLIGASVAAALFFLFKGRRITSRGEEVLRIIKDDCRTLYHNLKACPNSLSSRDLALAYGVFGGIALGTLNPFVQAKAAMSPQGKCSGCGSGCGGASCGSGGGGGGCGGGCGGCGGGCGG